MINPPRPICCFCEKMIALPSEERHEIKGFERGRAAGGTNAVELRQRTGRIACRWCIDGQKRGISPAQESLLA